MHRHFWQLLLLLRSLCTADTQSSEYVSSFVLPAYTYRPSAAEELRGRLASAAARFAADAQPLQQLGPTPGAFERVLANRTAPSPRVLLTYAYTDSPCQRRNLQFFLRHGLVPALEDGTPVDYSFILQGRNAMDIFVAAGVPYQLAYMAPHRRRDSTKREMAQPPEQGDPAAPPLVRLYVVDSEPGVPAVVSFVCAGSRAWGQGWAPSPQGYTHFVLVSGEARGPFAPAFARGMGLSWLDIALHALIAAERPGPHVVGSSLHCASALPPAPPPPAGGAPAHPYPSLHLHPTLLALDAAGLAAMAPHVHCYATAAEAQWQGVVGMTQAVLRAGGSVAALQGLWGGRAWSLGELGGPEAQRRCRAAEAAGGDTALPGAYFGGTQSPLETLFVSCAPGALEEGELQWLTDFADEFAQAG